MSRKELKDKLKELPDKPGVYIMRDINGEIIYVGKAISLKNRVSNTLITTRIRSQGTCHG